MALDWGRQLPLQRGIDGAAGRVQHLGCAGCVDVELTPAEKRETSHGRKYTMVEAVTADLTQTLGRLYQFSECFGHFCDVRIM